MKLGPLHVSWMSSRRERLIEHEVRSELRTTDVRNAIARLARGEVKNYLAELAEGADMPFAGAGSFLRGLRTLIEQSSPIADDPEPRCGARPYPAGSEGDDGTECVLPPGHEGNHRDWVDSLDGGLGFAPGDDEAVASNLMFERDPE